LICRRRKGKFCTLVQSNAETKNKPFIYLFYIIERAQFHLKEETKRKRGITSYRKINFQVVWQSRSLIKRYSYFNISETALRGATWATDFALAARVLFSWDFISLLQLPPDARHSVRWVEPLTDRPKEVWRVIFLVFESHTSAYADRYRSFKSGTSCRRRQRDLFVALFCAQWSVRNIIAYSDRVH